MKSIIIILCLSISHPVLSGELKSSILRHGVTWAFDRDYECGQFVNGDWWVTGPVNITAISPAPAGGMHGSMVNPSQMTAVQAYDSRMGGTTYNAGLLISAPVTLTPKTSLISTISHSQAGSRPQMKGAAVLTVVDAPQPADAFRPPYVGTVKPVYRTSQLQRNLLPGLTAVTGTPQIGTLVTQFDRVWLEHYSHGGDGTQYSSPSDNMPNYGREYATAVGNASLMLMLDDAWLQANQGQGKEALLIRMVQLGIDLYEVVEYGGNWPANGGLNHGRKWPILFAGIMLDHAGMKAIGTRGVRFHEDEQYFYVARADVDRTHSPDTRNCTAQEYGSSDIGTAEWGIRHATEPARDNKAWCAVYRAVNGPSICGIALSILIMDRQTAWNHDPFLDYADRWVQVEGETTPDTYPNLFNLFMWRLYRNNLPGPVGIAPSAPSAAISGPGSVRPGRLYTINGQHANGRFAGNGIYLQPTENGIIKILIHK